MDRHVAFTTLRKALEQAQPSPKRDSERLATGFAELDASLGGGIPRNGISCIEGRLGAGRSWLVAALLRQATSEGFAALLELPHSAEGYFAPPALARAGVQLARMLCLHLPAPLSMMRAAEWLMRSGSLRVLALPSVTLRDALWRRLAHIAEEYAVAVVAFGMPCAALRNAAGVRIASSIGHITWAGHGGPLGNIGAVEVNIAVLKQRHGVPSRPLRITAVPFAHAWSSPHHMRRHQITGVRDADFMRYRHVR